MDVVVVVATVVFELLYDRVHFSLIIRTNYLNGCFILIIYQKRSCFKFSIVMFDYY